MVYYAQKYTYLNFEAQKGKIYIFTNEQFHFIVKWMLHVFNFFATNLFNSYHRFTSIKDIFCQIVMS